MADFITEVSTERRARGGEQDEEYPVRLLRREKHEHDVGDAGNGQRDERRIDNGDEKDSEYAKAEEKMKNLAGVVVRTSEEEGGCGGQGTR